MNRTQTQRIMVFTCFICGCLALAAPEGKKDTTSSKERTEELNRRLIQMRKELVAAEEEAANKNKEFLQFEHDIVYTNEAASRVYREIKDLEKTLAEKRKELTELINKLPEMREMMKEREALFKRRADLKDHEQLILNEIKVEQWRCGKNSKK